MNLADDDSAPHEFGHILDLDDRYSDNKGIDKDWRGNIMAEAAMKGKVEQKNINELVKPLVEKYNTSFAKSINDKLGTNFEFFTKIDP